MKASRPRRRAVVRVVSIAVGDAGGGDGERRASQIVKAMLATRPDQMIKVRV